MNFYGLLTLQKINFNLASKWFITAKTPAFPAGVLVLYDFGGQIRMQFNAVW